MAIPGNITSPTSIGTNRLIRDGAEPLLEIADLMAHYPESGALVASLSSKADPPSPPPDLLPLERQVYEALRSQSVASGRPRRAARGPRQQDPGHAERSGASGAGR